MPSAKLRRSRPAALRVSGRARRRAARDAEVEQIGDAGVLTARTRRPTRPAARSPTAAAATCMRVAVSTPSIDASPARRPASMLRATMKKLGPGMRTSAAALAAKRSRVEGRARRASVAWTGPMEGPVDDADEQDQFARLLLEPARRGPAAARPARGAAARAVRPAGWRPAGAPLLARARARARRVPRRGGRRLRPARRRGVPGRPPGRAHARVRGGARRRAGAAPGPPTSARRASTSGPAGRTCRCSRAAPGWRRCGARCATLPTPGSTTATRAARPSCAARWRATSAACAAWRATRTRDRHLGMAQGMALFARALASPAVRRDRRSRTRRAGPAARSWRRTGSSGAGAGGPRGAAGRRARALAAPDAVLVTPAHQFPPGVVLSPERRAALLEWAARTGAAGARGRLRRRVPLRPPAGRRRAGPRARAVVYAGSVSQDARARPAAGLARGAPELAGGVGAAKARDDLGTPVVEQLALADFLERGELDRHLRRTRAIYRARRDALVAALARHLPDCRPAGVAAGLHLVVHLPARARRAGRARRGPRPRRGPVRPVRAPHAAGPPALLLGYGRIAEPAIEPGVRELPRIASRP